MRFRDFKRYYLELDYDWEKLQFLLSVLHRCLPLVRAELSAFRAEMLRGLSPRTMSIPERIKSILPGVAFPPLYPVSENEKQKAESS